MSHLTSQFWAADLGIESPFTIPSGIITTVPSVLARIARDVPQVGFLTTKTISLEPREGYREPVLHEYYPGCFVNAVGLANPGAESFVAAMRQFLPLEGNKPLMVSIMGGDAEEFLQCALILDPIADAFELNLSCPHVKGHGQAVGSDPHVVRAIIKLLKQTVSKPIVPKLSPNLGNMTAMAEVCREAGADGLSLINTVGPGTAVDEDGNPVLSNVAGGLSGAGILPIGLRAVREAAQAGLPIIAAGGISSASHVRAYRKAGARLFAVGSSLAGKTTGEVAEFFKKLAHALETDTEYPDESGSHRSTTRTTYTRTEVTENRSFGENLFGLSLKSGPSCAPGQFFFLRIPGLGEKPFSPMNDEEPCYLVRAVGPFTRGLARLRPGESIYLRGPYGNGFPQPRKGQPLVLIAGGTGTAPVLMAAKRWHESEARGFFGFSSPIANWMVQEIVRAVPRALIVVDPAGRVGMVLETLARDVKENRGLYGDSLVLVCGPGAMTLAALRLLDGTVPRDRIFVAREDIMRCGIGVCGSCGTETGLRSCVDGPVMNPHWGSGLVS